MQIIDISEHLPQNDDNVCCVTGVTGTTGPLFITKDRRSDIPEFFGNAVDEAATESKRKHAVSALSHLQYYMESIKYNKMKWDELTHDNIN